MQASTTTGRRPTLGALIAVLALGVGGCGAGGAGPALPMAPPAAPATVAFGLQAGDGLVAGEAWSGRPVHLRAVGHHGPVSFGLDSAFGGDLLVEGEGAATFVPAAGGPGTVRLEATDTGTGETLGLDLVVRPDPTAGFRGAFGASDVWFVDVRQKTGAHPYAADFHAALAAVGLRSPAATDALGSDADVLAALYVHVQLLRELSLLFGNRADGTRSPEGLALTLAFEEPGFPYLAPVPGARLAGGPDRFSSLRLEWRSDRGVFGTALIDDPLNSSHEGNASGPNGAYGVFLENVVAHFLAAYDARPLQAAPVAAADVPALRALLHGEDVHGERPGLLRRAGVAFARALARIAAHEIGHGLGLLHPVEPDPGSVMNAGIWLGPDANLAFTPENLDQLRTWALPGPGRATVAPRVPRSASAAHGATCTCHAAAHPPAPR